MIRRLAWLTLALWAAGSVALAGYVLAQHPFAAPVVDRTEADARAALTRAITSTATPDRIAARLAAAVGAKEPLDVALYLDLARDQGAVLPPDLLAEAEAMVAAAEGWLAELGACGTCAWDIASCQTLKQIGVCAIPVELSPLGDLNALRRVAVATAQGDEVDELEAGLALAGLAGTALMLASGGHKHNGQGGCDRVCDWRANSAACQNGLLRKLPGRHPGRGFRPLRGMRGASLRPHRPPKHFCFCATPMMPPSLRDSRDWPRSQGQIRGALWRCWARRVPFARLRDSAIWQLRQSRCWGWRLRNWAPFWARLASSRYVARSQCAGQLPSLPDLRHDRADLRGL